MNKLKPFIILLLTILFLSCEEEVEFDVNFKESLVVQGAIEPMMPAYVILTKTQSYFSEINSNTYENLFVSEAEVWIKKNNNQEKKLLNSLEVQAIYPWLNLPSCLYVENPANPIGIRRNENNIQQRYNNINYHYP